ncbi:MULTISPECIES: hypothetical protein [Pseudofrankia]|uniref:hypothetical protein n=1 Tax=Pseudofrankia TaxID=2994363 RepID=UPI000234C256|nr:MULTISPECIES: hypothetical protein [Pseudofrankia]
MPVIPAGTLLDGTVQRTQGSTEHSGAQIIVNTSRRIHLATAAYQAAQSQDQGPGIVLGLVVVFGLIAFTVGLTRHIRTLWTLSLTFLRPMLAAVRTLMMITLVIIIVVFGLAWSAHEDASAAPAVTVARVR